MCQTVTARIVVITFVRKMGISKIVFINKLLNKILKDTSFIWDMFKDKNEMHQNLFLLF